MTRVHFGTKPGWLTALVALWLAIPIAAPTPAMAQATASNNAGSIQLQPYTAPDQSASAGVPAGWNVTKGGETVITMTGPQGETIVLGSAMIARNGPFQPGQRPGAGVDLSMPYSANLIQKLAMILQQGAALAGKPAPQMTLDSATPLQLPPILGQCGRFVADLNGAQGPMKIMGAICSLPLDSGGIYKNIMLLAQAPPAVASQDAAIASAVFSTYHIPAGMLQLKLAPFTPRPMPRAGGGPGPIAMPDDTGAECFDLVVLRETPPSQLPRKCGGKLPD